MISNGQLANQTSFNNAFVSRTVDTSMAGALTMSKTTDASSISTGALIVAGGVGITKNLYTGALIRNTDLTDASSITTGALVTSGGMGIGKNLYVGGLGAFTGNLTAANLSGTNTGDVTFATAGAIPNANGASLTGQQIQLQPADGSNPGLLTALTQTIGGEKTFSGNVIISGDLTVNGTTTTVNSTNLDVTDQNITVNNGGNDASSEGAGLTVERTGTNGSIAYENALTSKWKVGALGSESEIITSAGTQTITGTKTFTGSITAANFTGSSSGTNTGDVTLGTFGASPDAKGATISGQVITIQPADATNPGAITTGAQSIAGAKSWVGAAIFQSILRGDQTLDAATTGSNASITDLKLNHKVTNVSLVSIRDIASPASSQFFILTNGTGASITIINNNAANTRIQTGTGADMTLANGASAWLLYDNDSALWRVVGGSGGGGGAFTLNAVGSSPNANGATYSSPNFNLEPADGTNPGIITAGTQTFGGNKTFSGSISASNLSGTNTGDNPVTLAAFGSTPNANGLTLTGQVLNMQPADSTNPGGISIVAQDIGGAKTFKAATTQEVSTIYKSSGANTVTVKAPSSVSTSHQMILPPDAGLQGQVIRTDGTNNLIYYQPVKTINYILNNDFEYGTTGWNQFKDSGATPTDGTGGTPDAGFTFTPTATALRGNFSGLITKGSSNLQGNGVSYDFTINRADQNRRIGISFNYETLTGTFTAGSASTNSVMTVWLYDVTNAALVTISPRNINGAVTNTRYRYYGEFQANTTSTNYRLIIYMNGTSTTAYTMAVDGFQASPHLELINSLFRANKASNQSLTNNTLTTISWDTSAVIDSMIGWDNSNNQFICQIEGYYEIAAGIVFAATTSEVTVDMRIQVNGSDIAQPFTGKAPTTASIPIPVYPPPIIHPLAVGDTVRIQGRQVSGGSLNVVGTASFTGCFWNIKRLHSQQSYL